MADTIIASLGGIPLRVKDNGDGTYSLATTASLAGDVEIGAVEIKNAADDTRAKVGAGNAIAETDNALAVGGQIGGHTVEVDLTLSLDTNIYAAADLLADTQELAGAVRVNAGTAILQSVQLLDADDQGQPLDLVFLNANQSMGTENSAPNISDANAAKIIGNVSVLSSDWIDIGTSRIATIRNIGLALKAAAGTTSIWVAALSQGTGTYTASGITAKFLFLQD
jgi:hypothetical protein